MRPRLPVLIAALLIGQPLVGEASISAPAGADRSVDVPAAAPAAGCSLLLSFGELRMVREVARTGLDRLVRRGPDDRATALLSHDGTETRVEWRKLRVSGIHEVGTCAADARRRIGRRILCTLRAECHRVWQPGLRAWSPWVPGAHPALPPHIEVICRDGRWLAVPAEAPFRPPAPARPRDTAGGSRLG